MLVKGAPAFYTSSSIMHRCWWMRRQGTLAGGNVASRILNMTRTLGQSACLISVFRLITVSQCKMTRVFVEYDSCLMVHPKEVYTNGYDVYVLCYRLCVVGHWNTNLNFPVGLTNVGSVLCNLYNGTKCGDQYYAVRYDGTKTNITIHTSSISIRQLALKHSGIIEFHSFAIIDRDAINRIVRQIPRSYREMYWYITLHTILQFKYLGLQIIVVQY